MCSGLCRKEPAFDRFEIWRVFSLGWKLLPSLFWCASLSRSTAQTLATTRR